MKRAFARLLAVLALSALAPASLAAEGFAPPRLVRNVTVIGYGETLEAAEAQAMAELTATYFVLDAETSDGRCDDAILPPPPNSTTPETVTICSIVVDAQVVRRVIWIK